MAKSGINKVILIGNLGADPEMRYMQNGTAVCGLRIATGESWKDKNTGETKERTEWHRVSLFGKLGEIAGQYLHKGSKVYVEGKLRTRKWQAQDGSDRYSTEVVVDGFDGVMQMLDSRGGGQGQSYGAAPQQRPAGTPGTADGSPASPPAQGGGAPEAFPGDSGFDDDIPF